jgi:hypothetical protein
VGNFDLKTAPIQFSRVEPGVYVSTCGTCGTDASRAAHVRELATAATIRERGFSPERDPDPAAHSDVYRLHVQRMTERPWEICLRGICGRFRIHRTVHTGGKARQAAGYSAIIQGPVRWWVTDVPTDQRLSWPHMRGCSDSTLEEAIRMLHVQIGRGIAHAFKEGLDHLRQIDCVAAVAEQRAGERWARTDKVAAILRQTYAHQTTAWATAEQIVDALFGANP